MINKSKIEDLLLEKYRQVGFVSNSGELWLDQQDALLFIDDCQRMDLCILGMECLKEENGELTLLLTWADFSSVSSEADAVELTCRQARGLVKGGLQDGAEWVTFVLDDGRTAKE